MFCLQFVRPPLPDFSAWEGRLITLTGRVVGKEVRTNADGEVLLITIQPSGDAEAGGKLPESFPGNAEGKVQCYLQAGSAAPKLGGTVRIAGELSCFERATNPGQFSQADYYQILKIDYKLYEASVLAEGLRFNQLQERLYRLKELFGSVINRYFQPEDATVMRTMLLGESGQTDREIKGLYQRNGIVHILAISGLHISLIGMGLYRLLRRLSVPVLLAAPAALAVMGGYGMMTGTGTSSLRAIIMFGMRMTALLLGRTYDLLTALAAAAIMILLEQPLYLYHSGFLYSFLAVLAIGLFIPAMRPSLPLPVPWLKKGLEALLSGCFISAVTLPVAVNFYYQFPPYSIFLNLLIIPLMSILMAAGLACMTAGIWLPLAGDAAAAVGGVVLNLYEKSCILTETLPGHNLILGKPQVWQNIVYIVVLLSLVAFQAVFHKKLPAVVRYAFLVLGILILTYRRPNGLTVAFLDVGQGDCVYIQTPGGKHYLIDCGSSSRQEVGRYRLLPYLKSQGVRRLDALFITHPDQDHHSALPELAAVMHTDGIPITTLVLPDIRESSKNDEYDRLEELARTAGINLEYISTGQKLAEGALELSCLHPDRASEWTNSNEYSAVLLLRYHRFALLLAGDVEGRGEAALLREISAINPFPELTVLKVAHHGSRNSTGQEFLRRVPPVIAVISAGSRNIYGHPHEELLERLKDSGARTYVTYKSGAVTVKTDGWELMTEVFNSE